jgi:hypothetical protein
MAKSLLTPLFPLPGTERGVDMVENIRRAKTRKKLKTSKPDIKSDS